MKMEQEKNVLAGWLRWSLFFLVAALSLSSYFLYDYLSTKRSFKTDRAKQVKEAFDASVKQLEDQLVKIIHATQELADKLSMSKVAQDKLVKQLQSLCTSHELVTAAGAAFSQFSYSPQDKFFAPFVIKQDTTFKQVQMQEFYNYTVSPWFEDSFAGKQKWTEPYFETASNQWVVRLITPIFLFDPKKNVRTPIGTVVADISLDTLQSTIGIPQIAKTDYAILISPQGKLLAHPTSDYIKSEKTLFDLGRTMGAKEFTGISNKILRLEEGTDTFYDSTANQMRYISYKPISTTKWLFAIISTQESSFATSRELRKKLVHCMLSIILLLILLILILVGLFGSGNTRWWITSVCSSIIIAGGIAFIWSLNLMSVIWKTKGKEIITNQIELDRFFELQTRLNPRIYRTKPLFVPTGIFIHSINIESGSKVTITGYVWQKYQLKVNEQYGEGIHILNTEKESYEKAYEQVENLVRTVGWKFRILLKESFDFSHYPFDNQIISLNIIPKSLDDNIVLVPDFESFQVTGSLYKELDVDLYIANWKVQRSYFFYNLSDMITNLGISNYMKQKNFPALGFDVNIERHFLGPMISGLVPIVIIIAIVFFTMIIATVGGTGQEGAILRLSSSTFFATAISHLTFRRALLAVDITYLEYFYFILYVLILLVTTNGLLYTKAVPTRFITYNENLIPKLLYWPAVLSILLSVTLIFFY